MQSCDVFHTQHANSLLLLIYVQVQCDLAITRNTCVNVCLLNCLNLFLKYKIGWTFCVCVCGLDLNAWHFSCWEMILRAWNVVWIFGWVACLIAFISVFSLLWKTVFKQSQYLLTARLSIKPFEFLFLIVVIAISNHRGFWDLVSIASWSIKEVSICSVNA